MSLFAVENMIVPEDKFAVCFPGTGIFLVSFLPEDNQCGLFAFADLATISADLSEGSVNPAFELVI